jgi:hypothetical protein
LGKVLYDIIRSELLRDKLPTVNIPANYSFSGSCSCGRQGSTVENLNSYFLTANNRRNSAPDRQLTCSDARALDSGPGQRVIAFSVFKDMRDYTTDHVSTVLKSFEDISY